MAHLRLGENGPEDASRLARWRAIHRRRQVAPAQPDRLVRFVVAVSHRLDHMAGRVAAGRAGGAVGNPVGLVRRARPLHFLPPEAILLRINS